MGRFRYAGRGPRQRHAFNQRTQYGVLLYRFVKKYPEWHLQPTHPVCGASNPKTLLMALYILQPTHPVWGASGLQLAALRIKTPFNQRTQYWVLPLESYATMVAAVTLQPAHPVWGAFLCP